MDAYDPLIQPSITDWTELDESERLAREVLEMQHSVVGHQSSPGPLQVPSQSLSGVLSVSEAYGFETGSTKPHCRTF